MYREITMIEVREVLALRCEGLCWSSSLASRRRLSRRWMESRAELQLDTGWVGRLTLPERKWRRFRAWIFTTVRSRHRFVYPAFEETTARAIEACEAAWKFFGRIFRVLIPDNTKAIIITADSLAPRIPPAFLEYAQARHFHIDPARQEQRSASSYVSNQDQSRFRQQQRSVVPKYR